MSNSHQNDRQSILGPTLHFKGELSADEELVIRGSVEGTINHSQKLVVGAGGRIVASIRARTVVVEGNVQGDVQAEQAVQVKETATVQGNLRAPSISIAEGANFNGSIDMGARAKASTSPESLEVTIEVESPSVKVG